MAKCQSELKVSDKYTRESPGLEASLTTYAFRKIGDCFGPFQHLWMWIQTWKGSLDLSIQDMIKWLKALSHSSNNLTCVRKCLVFLPPMILRLLKYLQGQKVSCVVVLPETWAPWRNLVDKYKLASFILAEPYNSTCFTITHECNRECLSDIITLCKLFF